MGRLQDKVAIITGAGQGIGLAYAERVGTVHILVDNAALSGAAYAYTFPANGSEFTGQDLAGACVFFASDDAKFVTGQTLVVDGGLAMPA